MSQRRIGIAYENCTNFCKHKINSFIYIIKTALVSTLSTSTCDVDEGYQGFCRWQYNPGKSRDEQYEWDCYGQDPWCEAYSNGECTFVNTTFSYTGCNGEIYDETSQYYRKCCDPSIDGDNCNYEIIDTDSCTRNIERERELESFLACLFADDGAYRQYACDDYVTEITCDAVEALYSQQANCLCSVYTGLYEKVSAASKLTLQSTVDGFLAPSSEWNEIFGCDIKVTCDLSSGKTTGVVTSNPSPNPTPLPTQSPLISNKCIPICDETAELCLANGECQAKVSDTECTSTAQCRAKDGENFVCETENSGGFCYYDECVATGGCDDGYKCVSSTDTQNDIEYKSGVCEEIGGDEADSVKGWDIIAAIIASTLMAWME